MAKSSTSIKPGQVLNPGGRAKMPEDLKAIMRTTGEQMKRVMCEVIAMSVGDIQEIDGNPPKDMNIFRAALISSLNNTLQSADDRSLRLIMDRLLGKVPEAVIETDDGLPTGTKDETINKLVNLVDEYAKSKS